MVSLLSSLPVWLKAQLGPGWSGCDKLPIRLLTARCGAAAAARRTKRAIQFGSRIAKLESRTEKAADVCDRLTEAGESDGGGGDGGTAAPGERVTAVADGRETGLTGVGDSVTRLKAVADGRETSLAGAEDGVTRFKAVTDGRETDVTGVASGFLPGLTAVPDCGQVPNRSPSTVAAQTLCGSDLARLSLSEPGECRDGRRGAGTAESVSGCNGRTGAAAGTGGCELGSPGPLGTGGVAVSEPFDNVS